MRSTSRRSSSVWEGEQVGRWEGRHRAAIVPAVGVALLISAGCARVPNQFREDGPATMTPWDTPTAQDVKVRIAPAEPRYRDWEACTVATESGAIQHEPLYFEDPFVDKGHGRTDETHPQNVYRLGWEDFVATPYCIARYTANWLLLPVSAIVTPPWTVMESDGVLSRQLLGYDHDAAPMTQRVPQSPPAAERKASAEGRAEVRRAAAPAR